MAVIEGWKFPVEVDEKNGKIKTVEDNECIKQDIKIIMGTQYSERKVVPEFGTDIRRFVFDVVDPPFIDDLKKEITDSINQWEEHIDDLNVNVRANSGPICRVDVNVDYITDLEPTQERVSRRVDQNEE